MKIKLLYYFEGTKKTINYSDVAMIYAGRADTYLTREDCDGNGIAYNAPIIQLVFCDKTTATFDADRVIILPA